MEAYRGNLEGSAKVKFFYDTSKCYSKDPFISPD
jgi:hypothetical protein